MMAYGARTINPAARLHGALKAAVKRSIVVMDAMLDPERRFLRPAGGMASLWSQAIDQAEEAYGYTQTRVRFIPTAREIAQAETVADWLSWLAREKGRECIRLLTSWAREMPIWKIAQFERCSERSVHNRIDRLIAAIQNEFAGPAASVDIQEVNERPGRAHPPNFMTERPEQAEAGGISSHAKVWIGGVGFMKNGKRWRNGHDKAERTQVHGN
ncbi:hypothetical protein EOW77_0032275 [Bradyrhizobium yuanmingense]|uniref:DUF6362 family protein n=1 Tax=Bradyrhizobium yuanmingense TaxID=108015 RepID=UPI000FE3E653|nr:DUF6362 family protein [Bradyrhizobium yuanmingense]TGN75947.1 hypothetical protein EOW77_0032275 [Bradyrhizobium yuanmingense]